MRALLDVSPADEVRSAMMDAYFVPTPGGSRQAFAWTPDGRTLVFAGRSGDTQQLFVRRLEGGEARPLAGTVGAQTPVISADGKWVAFWADGAIRKLPLAGGPASVLAEDVGPPPMAMDWGVTGLLIYDRGGPAARTVWKVRAGADPAAVSVLATGELQHITPHLLPGDTAVLFTVRKRAMTWGDDEVVAQVLATGQRKTLLTNATDARYLAPGRLIFMRQGTLFAVPFDPDRLELKGEPVAMLAEVAHSLVSGLDYWATGVGQFAVSAAGDLAYIPGPVLPPPENRLVTVDRTGRVEPLPAPVRSYIGPTRVSHDGRKLAVTIRSLTELGIWIYDLTQQTLTKLTPPGGEFSAPLWTPDGRRIAFRSVQSGVRTVAWQRAEGGAPPELLVGEFVSPGSWSPDGRELAVVKDAGIWGLEVTVEPPMLRPLIPFTVQGSATAYTPQFSPDGHWLLFQAGFEMDQIYLEPYPGPGPRLQVSGEAGITPAWNPNGREIFFLAESKTEGRGRMMSVDVTPGASATFGTPRELFEFDPEELPLDCDRVLACYSVSPDGQRFFAWQRGPDRPAAARNPDPSRPELARRARGQGAVGVVRGSGRLQRMGRSERRKPILRSSTSPPTVSSAGSGRPRAGESRRWVRAPT